MPSIFTHAVFAGLLGRTFAPKRLPFRFWLFTALCPMIPDADAVAFALNVQRGSIWGHRGITHSILFAAVLGYVIALFGFGRSKPLSRPFLMAYFSLITITHPLLDMLTNGGSGVALFAPFSSERFFFPWRPIEVSPIGLDFFSSRGLDVLLSEIEWAWVPALVILASSLLIRKLANRQKPGSVD
jgi:inner membrane protein